MSLDHWCHPHRLLLRILSLQEAKLLLTSFAPLWSTQDGPKAAGVMHRQTNTRPPILFSRVSFHTLNNRAQPNQKWKEMAPGVSTSYNGPLHTNGRQMWYYFHYNDTKITHHIEQNHADSFACRPFGTSFFSKKSVLSDSLTESGTSDTFTRPLFGTSISEPCNGNAVSASVFPTARLSLWSDL